MKDTTKITVDRIEGEYAACELEDGSMIDVALSELPPDVHEGSVLTVRGRAVECDYSEEERRREALLKIQNDMFEN